MIRRRGGGGGGGCRIGVGQGCESQHERRAAEGEAVGGVAKGPAGAGSDERHHRVGAVDIVNIGNARRSLDAGGRRRGQLGKTEKTFRCRTSLVRLTNMRFGKALDRLDLFAPHARPTRGLWRIDTTRACDATGGWTLTSRGSLGARGSFESSIEPSTSPLAAEMRGGARRVGALSPPETPRGVVPLRSDAKEISRIAGCAGTRGAPRRIGRSWGGAVEGRGAMSDLYRSGRTVSRVRRWARQEVKLSSDENGGTL